MASAIAYKQQRTVKRREILKELAQFSKEEELHETKVYSYQTDSRSCCFGFLRDISYCYNPQIAGNILAGLSKGQVSNTQTPHDFVDFDSLTILNQNFKAL